MSSLFYRLYHNFLQTFYIFLTIYLLIIFFSYDEGPTEIQRGLTKGLKIENYIFKGQSTFRIALLTFTVSPFLKNKTA